MQLVKMCSYQFYKFTRYEAGKIMVIKMATSHRNIIMGLNIIQRRISILESLPQNRWYQLSYSLFCKGSKNKMKIIIERFHQNWSWLFVWLYIAQTLLLKLLCYTELLFERDAHCPSTYRSLQQVNKKLLNVSQKATRYNTSIIDNFFHQKNDYISIIISPYCGYYSPYSMS